MGTTTRSRGTSIPRTANSYGDEPNDCGDDSAPVFRRIRERRGARRHEEERLPGGGVVAPGADRGGVRHPRRGGARRGGAHRAQGPPARGRRQDRPGAGLVPPRRIGPAHARGMAQHPRSDPGPMDREETARLEGRGSLIPTGGFQLGEPYLPSSDGADRARMNDEVERDVRFDGATARLRGRLRPPIGGPWGSLVMSHGRSEDMGSPLLEALAQSAADQGLSALRFNFAFADAGSEPSGGHVDEIADLREAMGYARTMAGLDTVFVAGRGLGAWAAVAAATDELCAGAILLGLSYTGQPERRVALERLEEFEVPTLVLVGFESDRTDLPLLRDLVASMTSVNLEIIAGADHRLKDAAGRTMTEAVLMPVEAWLHLRKKERDA